MVSTEDTFKIVGMYMGYGVLSAGLGIIIVALLNTIFGSATVLEVGLYVVLTSMLMLLYCRKEINNYEFVKKCE